MAKKVLKAPPSPPEGGDVAAKEIRKRLKTAFDDFPTSGKLYHDGNEVYFYQAKPQMTMVKRADFFNPTAKKE